MEIIGFLVVTIGFFIICLVFRYYDYELLVYNV
jgi:hypothetical protein